MKLESRANKIINTLKSNGRVQEITKDIFQASKYINSAVKIKSDYNRRVIAQESYSLWKDVL
jgi:hypothetical protein